MLRANDYTKQVEDERDRLHAQVMVLRAELAALREQVTDADNLIADWKPHMYCEHGRLRTYWCEQCSIPAPSQDDTRDAERYRYLRNRVPASVLGVSGPDAGVWCDCDDEYGALTLLTGEDLDVAIDAILAAKKEGKP